MKKKRHVITVEPEWCEGWLRYDTDAVDEQDALNQVVELMKRNAKPSMLDVTILDVFEDDDPAYDVLQHTTEVGSYR
tara:strand:+ start:343 stop:573 length:231 start_codon:yes stop_codon:yes gene_type:complete